LKQSKKQQQVAALIKREFSNVLQKEGQYLYSSEIMVTVTNVRMSADMGIAYIYLSVFNTDDKEDVIKRMWDNLSQLRGKLGTRIRNQVRRIPRLKFFIDDTLDEMDHLNDLFDKIHAKENSMRSMKDAQKEKDEEE